MKSTITMNKDDDDDDDDEPEFTDSTLQTKFYTISYNNYQEQRIKTDAAYKSSTAYFKNILSADAYLRIAYRLLLLMIK